NGGLGINLVSPSPSPTPEPPSTVTPNDPGDTDTGPNNLQNFPVITSATAGSTTVSGTLDSYDGGTFTIEVFSNSACDASGNGEGKTYLGSGQTVATGTPGHYTFQITVGSALNAGQVLTATATDEATANNARANITPAVTNGGNTSEFSQCFTVAAPTISGHVGYCITPSQNVPGVSINVTGSQTTSTNTDSSGNYSLSLPQGGTYTLTPTKNALSAHAAGIDTADVLGVQRHYLHIALLSGCAATAAD